MKITKEQVKELSQITNAETHKRLKQWFPKAFEEKVKPGMWVKCKEKGNILFFKSTELLTDDLIDKVHKLK